MKYALITGGSRGIGAAAARLFARRGWGVAVAFHQSGDRAQALVRELQKLGVPAVALRADVADPRQVGELVDNVLEKFCQLDILVCAAGISHVGLISQIDEDQWRRVVCRQRGRRPPLLPRRPAPYALPKERLHCHGVLHVGAGGGLL